MTPRSIKQGLGSGGGLNSGRGSGNPGGYAGLRSISGSDAGNFFSQNQGGIPGGSGGGGRGGIPRGSGSSGGGVPSQGSSVNLQLAQGTPPSLSANCS
eukprot:scaffold78473_cov15-Tisochrysis_lutea.AAC.1